MKRLLQAISLGFLGLVGLSVLMGSGVVPGAYNTIENNGTPLTKRSILNFPNSGCVDNSGNASTDCTFLTASTVPGNYTQSFVSQTTVILTHNLNTTAVIVQCYDAASPPAMIIPNTTKITDANDVTVTFTGSQSGKCQVSGSNASGGGGGSSIGIIASQFLQNDGSTASLTDVNFSPADTLSFTLSTTSNVVINYQSICYSNVGGGAAGFNSLYVDGVHVVTSPNADWQYVPNASTTTACPLGYVASLGAGAHTVSVQHRVSSGTGEWWNRAMTAAISN